MIEIVIQVIAIAIMSLFVYVGIHMSREKHEGKYIPMFWEKEKNGTSNK